MILDRLPTKDRLLERGVTLNNTLCPFCQTVLDSKSHIFEVCCKVLEVKRKINGWWRIFPEVDTGDTEGIGSAIVDTSKKDVVAKEVVETCFHVGHLEET